jgi:uncharacterized protein (TIGR02611 family)
MTAESDDNAGVEAAGPRLGSRAPAFVRRSRPLHLVWQAGVFVVGLAVVAGGVVLLPLPGPGWLVIFGGFAIWGTEFAWAQRVLFWTKQKARGGWRAAKRRFTAEGAEEVEGAGEGAGAGAGDGSADRAGDGPEPGSGAVKLSARRGD